MKRQPVLIKDTKAATFVEASLLVGLTAAQIRKVERIWQPARDALEEKLTAAGINERELPEHLHWNWKAKAPLTELASYQAIGIEHTGQMQGMMLAVTDGSVARLDPDIGKPLVYIDYLETAPWNFGNKEWADILPPPLYLMVGTRFIEVAVHLSREFEYRGRVGLHSLPQSETFYRRNHFQFVGYDAAKQNLPYLELTRAAADAHWKEAIP